MDTSWRLSGGRSWEGDLGSLRNILICTELLLSLRKDAKFYLEKKKQFDIL